MLIVRYETADGRRGEDSVAADQKWTFGRPDGENVPDVAVDDPRISRGALVIRDSGPGPIVFRGQRGEQAVVELVADDGTRQQLDEGTAGNLTPSARVVEFGLAGQSVIRIEVEFTERGTVVERQHAADAEPVA